MHLVQDHMKLSQLYSTFRIVSILPSICVHFNYDILVPRIAGNMEILGISPSVCPSMRMFFHYGLVRYNSCQIFIKLILITKVTISNISEKLYNDGRSTFF